MSESRTSTLKRDARWVLGIASLLTVIGLIFIYSSSSVFALEKCGSTFYFLKKQALFLIPAIMFFLSFALMPLSFWKKYAPWCFLAALGFTALTFVPALG